MPDRMPEGMPDIMLEDMPDNMPEGMPDRMPEDVPEHKRFLSCRLIVADSALLVADSDWFWLPTQTFSGCRLIVADSALLVADSDRDHTYIHIYICIPWLYSIYSHR